MPFSLWPGIRPPVHRGAPSSRSFARGLDIARLDHIARLVAPAVALERDDRSDVGVGELLAEGRHRRALLAVQYDLDVAAFRLPDERGAVERLERSLYSLAAGLVERYTVRRVDLLAARFQLGKVTFLLRVVCGGSQLLFLLAHPRRVFLRGDHFYHDRHDSVILAAKLCALPAVGSFLFRAEP